MLAISNTSNATPALKKKTKKGLALRDITNQTPHPKTLKKSIKKPVNTLKKVLKTTITSTNTQNIKDDVKIVKSVKILDNSDEIEYMPPNSIPIKFTDDDYKIDTSFIKPTSKGCVFIPTDFKNFLDDDFSEDEIVFKSDSDLKFLDADASFLYF